MILKIFLKQGLSGLEVLLRNNTEDVTNILKTMQQSTRFINSICVQAKVINIFFNTIYTECLQCNMCLFFYSRQQKM